MKPKNKILASLAAALGFGLLSFAFALAADAVVASTVAVLITCCVFSLIMCVFSVISLAAVVSLCGEHYLYPEP